SAYGKTTDQVYGTYQPQPVATNMLYDMASLTKVMATTCVIMHMVERGLVRLSDPISQYIPQFATNQQKAQVTLWDVLTHTSGLPGPIKLYQQYQSREQMIEGICRQELLFVPGTSQTYSDLGFMLLGEVVRIVSMQNLDAYAQHYLFEPLRMKDTLFNPPPSIWDRVIPTEYVEWRSGLVHGRVHDENAEVMGGVAGQAGLFSTIEDVATFCTMILNFGEYAGTRILGHESVLAMTSVQSVAPDESFGLGWVINAPYFMGSLTSNDTFGHTGFTGTSMVLNLNHSLALVLLSNRVCPTRNGLNINLYRQRIANTVAELCKEK
ncbi:MAG: serine hydrolase, partial [Chloroflexota bacterium]|nr:serine hydrolase [Chloroflexota bacterium]